MWSVWRDKNNMAALKRYPKKIGVGGAIITPYAKRLVNQVLDSGRISYGPMLRRFEEEFARVSGRKFAVSANSGTSALQVAFHALKEKAQADGASHLRIIGLDTPGDSSNWRGNAEIYR